ncbi:MAG: flagellar hook-length control protein FliK [Spirochaetes bacterium]|nr:flagellar hook-length control protein FliK [Spirochaetota bacterium]
MSTPMILVPRVEVNNQLDSRDVRIFATGQLSSIENGNFLNFVQQSIANDAQNENTNTVRQTDSEICRQTERDRNEKDRYATVDESRITNRLSNENYQSRSGLAYKNSQDENDYTRQNVEQNSRNQLSEHRDTTSISRHEKNPSGNEKGRRETSFQRKIESAGIDVFRTHQRSNPKVPLGVGEHLESALAIASELARELPTQFVDLRQALRDFSAHNSVTDLFRQKQSLQELLLKVRLAVEKFPTNDDVLRSDSVSTAIHLRQKLKTLAESLDRVYRHEGEQRYGRGHEQHEGRNVPEGASRVVTNSSEIRYETAKQQEGFIRIDTAGGTPLRNIASAHTSVAAKALPFLPDQFEILLQHARITVRDAQNGSFSINLYPENLGRVNVNLGLDEGVLVGRFLVETPQAREAIQESLERLIAQLVEAGIEVGSFQVNVRGERDRLVQELKGYLAENRMGSPKQIAGEYETQSARSHDGLLDVIA